MLYSDMPQDSGIYLIVCSTPLYRYVGSAINLHKRASHHIAMLRTGKHCNDYLQHAFNCYGENAFTFEVLELVSDDHNLIIREQHYIDALSPEYNLCPVAGNSLGYRHRDETKKIMSAKARTRKRNPHSPETIEKIRQSNRGQKRPPEMGIKHSQMIKGKRLSPEARAKMSASRRGRHHTLETRVKIADANRRRVVTEETKERIRLAKKGINLSTEHKVKISASGKGRVAPPVTEEMKQHLREVNLGKKHTEESKAKMSASRKGKKRGPMSAETKAKISETKRVRNAERQKAILEGVQLTLSLWEE